MSEGPIIVVKKVKKGHGGHHGGAWKVAYADFVTAMMALFIVLWILGQGSSVRQYVAAYFTDPMAFEHAVAMGEYDTGAPGNDTNDQDQGNPFLMPDTFPTPYINPDSTGNSMGGSPGSGSGNEKEIMEKMAEKIAEKIEKELGETPEFERIKDKVQIQVGDNMAVIELIEPEKAYFFDKSESTMKPQAKKLLGVIAKELNSLPNKIVIAGHTDSHPYNSKTYSNWELSADRANSARRVMESAGFDSNKILEVKGCADKNLKYPNDPFNPMNRRISIIVLFENLFPGTKDSHDISVKESHNTPVEESHNTPVEESHNTPVEESHNTPVEESHNTPVEESHDTHVEEGSHH